MRTTFSPMLGHLAAERATGALLRDAGTLYLRDGEIVHAESPVSPGVDLLLVLGGRVPAEHWQDALDRAGTQQRVGDFLVDSGRITRGELEIYHLGALYDAAFFALAPGRRPARFRDGATHWLGPVRPVGARTLQREILRRRRLLEELWPFPEVDTVPVVRRSPSSPHAPVPTDRQRTVLELADGVRTPADIARGIGRLTFHVLIDVRRLAAAGHIETPRTGEPSAPDPSADPEIALLRRIRDALEARL